MNMLNKHIMILVLTLPYDEVLLSKAVFMNSFLENAVCTSCHAPILCI